MNEARNNILIIDYIFIDEKARSTSALSLKVEYHFNTPCFGRRAIQIQLLIKDCLGCRKFMCDFDLSYQLLS